MRDSDSETTTQWRRANREWQCPRCGEWTSGSYSLGGLAWAICGSCMAREQRAIRERWEEEED